MNKRNPYTIIPKFIKTFKDITKGANIKIIHWERKCEENSSWHGYTNLKIEIKYLELILNY